MFQLARNAEISFQAIIGLIANACLARAKYSICLVFVVPTIEPSRS